MTRKNKIISIVVAFASCMALATTSYGQDKYQYLTVRFGVNYGDSTSIAVDTLGMAKVLQDDLKAVIPRKILNGTENRLFNELGELGWELFEIEYNQNYLYPGQTQGSYYFTNAQGKGTKYFFKIILSEK
ncbi:hypothetical protein [Echinicola sp. 20G]|uniref:hypothetical protein n=1 Tax=Echinicola sp. 20G TaxID=2781961 RepID=UPI0019106871|nr:hypothetical protein [Echinicola sp. 20G]